jgi:hypothetical protein
MRDMYQAVDFKARETLNNITDQIGVPDAVFSGVNDNTLGPEDPDYLQDYLTGTVPGARGTLAGLALKERTGSDMVQKVWTQWTKTIDMYFRSDHRSKWAPLVANATEALLANLEPYMERLFGVYATDVSNRLQILAATVRGVAYFGNLKLQAQNTQFSS